MNLVLLSSCDLEQVSGGGLVKPSKLEGLADGGGDFTYLSCGGELFVFSHQVV